jgi:hypothetical protein
MKNIHLLPTDKPHSFCETPEEKCTMNYCDENGCLNRKRELVEPKQESKQDRTCTNNCSVVCGECQILKPKQETIEEVAKRTFTYEYGEETFITDIKRDAFIEGSKSDAAREYWFKIFQEQLKNHVETFLSNAEANRR